LLNANKKHKKTTTFKTYQNIVLKSKNLYRLNALTALNRKRRGDIDEI